MNVPIKQVILIQPKDHCPISFVTYTQKRPRLPEPSFRHLTDTQKQDYVFKPSKSTKRNALNAPTLLPLPYDSV